MAKYKLKEGIVLRPYGVNSKIDNSNLTDAIAELFLENGKANSEHFIDEKIDVIEIITPKKKQNSNVKRFNNKKNK